MPISPNETPEESADSKKARRFALESLREEERRWYNNLWTKRTPEEIEKEIARLRQYIIALGVGNVDGEHESWRLATLVSILEEKRK